MKAVVVQREVEGRTFTLETGVLAPQADAAVVVRCGDSMVLVTVVRCMRLDESRGIGSCAAKVARATKPF